MRQPLTPRAAYALRHLTPQLLLAGVWLCLLQGGIWLLAIALVAQPA